MTPRRYSAWIRSKKVLLDARWGASLLALGISLILTGVAWYYFRQSIENSAQAQFERMAAQLEEAVKIRAQRAVDDVLKTRGLFIANPHVTHAEFRSYMDSLRFDETFKGIEGLGYVPRVKQSRLQAHLRSIWQEGYVHHTIWPAERRSDYFPIVYIQPFNGQNQRVFGFDLASDPILLDAMVRARDSGLPQAAPRLNREQSPRAAQLFDAAIFAPVYEKLVPNDTLEQKRRALVGYVFSTIRYADFFGSLFASASLKSLPLDLEVFDGTELFGPTLVYDSDDKRRFDSADAPPRFSKRSLVKLADRDLTLHIATQASFDQSIPWEHARIIWIPGALVAFLIFFLVRSEIKHSATVSRLWRKEQRARREAEQAVRIRDEFLSIASHELKTPLTSLKLQAQIVQKLTQDPNLASEWSDKLPRLLASCEGQIERLSQLVNDLLDITRIQNGKFNLSPTELDLGELVQDVVDRFAAQLEEARCKLTMELQTGVKGYWDRYRIEQVVINLLSNAMKYGQAKPIHIQVGLEGPNAVLSVRDHGMGIPLERQAKIFDRFERVAGQEMERQITGLGLGLYIVKQILSAHGGTIQVASEPGKGSVFTVTLNARPAEAAPGLATAVSSEEKLASSQVV